MFSTQWTMCKWIFQNFCNIFSTIAVMIASKKYIDVHVMGVRQYKYIAMRMYMSMRAG